MPSRFVTPSRVAAVGLAAVCISGAAYAAIPSSDGSIKACYAKQQSSVLGIPYHKGEVRIVDSGEGCRAYESAISWNQKGQPGPAGPQGPAGPAGGSSGITKIDTDAPFQAVPDSTDQLASATVYSGQGLRVRIRCELAPNGRTYASVEGDGRIAYKGTQQTEDYAISSTESLLDVERNDVVTLMHRGAQASHQVTLHLNLLADRTPTCRAFGSALVL